MGWIIGLLTVVLVLNCLLLILLVLIQLPKKEAGLGTAFGGGATDALFGAGSGNALTKMTKYATGVFFVLTLSLSILNAQHSKNRRSGFEKELQKAGQQTTVPQAEAAPTASTPAAPVAAGTNVVPLTVAKGASPLVTGETNTPAKAATNSAASTPADKPK